MDDVVVCGNWDEGRSPRPMTRSAYSSSGERQRIWKNSWSPAESSPELDKQICSFQRWLPGDFTALRW